MSYTISRDEKILHVHATLRSEAEFAAFIDKLTKEYRDFFVPAVIDPKVDPNTGC